MSSMTMRTWCLILGLAAGCDADDSAHTDRDPSEDDGRDAGPGDGGSGHAYVVGSTLRTPDGWDAYVAILPNLEAQEVDYDRALEVPGRADVWVWNGKVYIAEAESPVVQRYEVDDDLGLEPDGERLSFADTGLSSAQFWNAIWLTPDKAYMNNPSALEYVIWNPDTMEIEGQVPHPEIEERNGYVVRNSSTNRGSIVRNGKLYHTYYWTDENYEKYAPESRIAVYDVETDELLDVIDAPCPGLEIITQDDEQNLYFSSWTGLPGLSLVLGEPTSCALKLPAGSDELDLDWTVSWPDVAEGRHGAALRFQGGHYGLVSIFHDERLEYDEDSDAFELIGTENWETWRFDLRDRSAEPMEGIAPNSGAIYVERIDDHAYGLIPTMDYMTSEIYALDGDSGERLLETRGWCTRLFKLR